MTEAVTTVSIETPPRQRARTAQALTLSQHRDQREAKPYLPPPGGPAADVLVVALITGDDSLPTSGVVVAAEWQCSEEVLLAEEWWCVCGPAVAVIAG